MLNLLYNIFVDYLGGFMKKLICVLSAVLLFAGCASVKQAANLKNCTYSFKSVEVENIGLKSIDLLVTIAITNPNKSEAAKLKRFDGVLTANDDKIANLTLKDISIPAGGVYNAKAKVAIPTATLSSKLLGLLSMGSGTIDYHLTGTMFFEGPMGVDIPLPVDIGRLGSYNS